MYQEVKLSQVIISSTNPRKHMNPEKFAELVENVRKHGIIEPIVIRKNGKADQFELVVGERRFRAAQEAKLVTIPASIRELTDEDALELQIIENLHREDLTPLEEAHGFHALIEKCKLKQEDLAKKITKSQGYIALRLALLDLREDFQKLLEEGKLAPGHMKFIMNFKGSKKIQDNMISRLKDHWKNSDSITVREFQDLALDVTQRQSKPLYKSQYGGNDDPGFDLKACEKCQHNKTVDLKYDKNKKRCFNPECWGEKQTTVRRAEAERIREKVKSGKLVNQADLPKDVQNFDQCGFDKKTCAKCDKRKVGLVKDYSGDKVKKEICLDKECFGRKRTAAKEAGEKARAEAHTKAIAKCKEKAAKTILDRNFFILLLVEKLDWNKREVFCEAYGIKKDKIDSDKKATEYFTGNTKLNVEEMLCFLTYWKD